MFYIAHRLFAAHDRALGALAARTLAATVGPGEVFLPFCDTDEQNLIADVKGRRLFDLDSQRLRRLAGMLAIVHGPSLDDGVCMEIGFAAALGVPVVAVTTDFITYAASPHTSAWSFPDPLLDHLATEVIAARLLQAVPHGSADRLDAFEHRNRSHMADAISLACQRLVAIARTAEPVDAAPSASQSTAFVEPSPYRLETDEVDTRLRELGYGVVVAGRLTAADPVQTAAIDWSAATAADLLVADVSGPEAPPGAAAMIGAAVATGRRILAYNPRPAWTFAHGREPNWRNLMVQYGVDGMFSTPAHLATLARR